jgi:hypothetical protein
MRKRKKGQALSDEAALKQVSDCHREWQKLTNIPRLPFRAFLARTNQRTFAALVRNPALCRKLPREVQRALRKPRGKQLVQKVLKSYMPQLAERFLKEGRSGTFESFLKEAVAACTTEEELKLFLKEPKD